VERITGGDEKVSEEHEKPASAKETVYSEEQYDE
jgi:hypothetical protein